MTWKMQAMCPQWESFKEEKKTEANTKSNSAYIKRSSPKAEKPVSILEAAQKQLVGSPR